MQAERLLIMDGLFILPGAPGRKNIHSNFASRRLNRADMVGVHTVSLLANTCK